jgi:predicted RNA-binding protein with RPS1 domain
VLQSTVPTPGERGEFFVSYWCLLQPNLHFVSTLLLVTKERDQGRLHLTGRSVPPDKQATVSMIPLPNRRRRTTSLQLILLACVSFELLAFQSSHPHQCVSFGDAPRRSPFSASSAMCTALHLVSDTDNQVVNLEQSQSAVCYYRRVDGSWKPRKEIERLFVGERLFAKRLSECDLLDGKTGAKGAVGLTNYTLHSCGLSNFHLICHVACAVSSHYTVFLECGVGKMVDDKGKWRIINGMLRIGTKKMKPSVVQKKLKKLPDDKLFEVYVSKINLEHGSFEVCLKKEDALEARVGKSRFSASRLTPGQVLQGRVKQVTDYGVFVDVGANRNGLIHISKVAVYKDKFINKEEGLKKIGLKRGAGVEVIVLSNEKKRLELDLPPPTSKEVKGESKGNSGLDDLMVAAELSEDEALAWAAYASGNDQPDASQDEEAMWAAYADYADMDNDDEDRDIEDALGIGTW